MIKYIYCGYLMYYNYSYIVTCGYYGYKYVKPVVEYVYQKYTKDEDDEEDDKLIGEWVYVDIVPK